MTETTPAADVFPRPDPVLDAHLGELRELATRYPEPMEDEVMADWVWLHAEAAAGRLFDLYDQNVAACEGKVVGTGPDHLALRIRLAKELGRHPERFAISWFGEYVRPDFFGGH